MSLRKNHLLLAALIISISIPLKAQDEPKQSKREQFKEFIENAVPSALLGLLIGGILYLGILKHKDIPVQAAPPMPPIPAPKPKGLPKSSNVGSSSGPSEQSKDAHSEDNDPRQCGICLDAIADRRVVHLGCGHEFCRPCLGNIIQIGINEKNFSTFKCPNCRAWWVEDDLLKIANEDQLEQIGQIYLDRLAENPAPSRSSDPRRDPETESWMTRYVQDCPQCHAPISRDGGCEMIVCTRCHHRFKFKARRAPRAPMTDHQRRHGFVLPRNRGPF